MIPKDLFGDLPYGVCPFEKIKDRLLNCRRRSLLPDRAESVIVVLFPYYLGKESYQNLNISMYAVSEDYHLIAGEILEKAAYRLRKQYPDNAFVPFCDNSPIPEVLAAASAGLGRIGKNGLLIHEAYGSFCFIGEIVTDLAIPAEHREPKPCIRCGKCEQVCPTGALQGNTVATELCLSQISQKKKDLTEREKELIAGSGCAWGCDICQKVCPMNRNILQSPIAEFYSTARPHIEPGVDITDRAYAWRGENVINRNLEILADFAHHKKSSERRN